MARNYKLLGILVIIIIINITEAFNVASITDSDTSNNQMSVNVTIVDTKNFKVIFRRIDLSDLAIFDNHVELFLDYFNKTYPVADTELLMVKGSSYTTTENERNNLGQLLANIAKRDLIIGQKTRTVGVVPQYWFKNYTNEGPNTIGYASRSFTPYFSAIPSGLAEARNNRFIASHEIGHTFSLCDEHTASEWDMQDIPLFRCPNGDLDDNNALDNNCTGQGCPVTMLGKLAPWNSSSEFVIMDNFMGSESPNPDQKWITVESYNALLSGIKVSAVESVIVSTAILIDGWINKSDDTMNINKPYLINNAEITLQDTNDSGNYSIEVIDNNGLITSKINFTPPFLKLGLGGNTTETNISYFIVVLNFSSNDKGIVLRHKGVVKDGLNKTANHPTLNITSNLDGSLVNNNFSLAYNGADVDGDTLQYAILISSDGGSNYTTLDIDYPNQTFFVNTSGFTESTQYKVKILATDGINTNTTISNAFEIDNDMRIINLSTMHENRTRKIFFYKNKNTLEDRLNSIVEKLDTGDSTIQFSTNHSLNSSEEVFVFVEYNYTTVGDKTLIATATSGSLAETESTSINVPDIEVLNLVVLDSNLTKRIFRFDIKNNLDINLTNINWTFDTNNSYVINSTITSILKPAEQLFIYIDYNFTSTGTFNTNATAKNGTLTDSRNLTISI